MGIDTARGTNMNRKTVRNTLPRRDFLKAGTLAPFSAVLLAETAASATTLEEVVGEVLLQEEGWVEVLKEVQEEVQEEAQEEAREEAERRTSEVQPTSAKLLLEGIL